MDKDGFILVTGATGFVGKWLVLELLRRGYAVRGTVRTPARFADVTDTIARELGAEALSRLSLVEADLLSDDGWREAMSDVMSVAHVAAAIRGDEPRDSSLVVRPAVEGTERVLRFAHAAGVDRVVLTSSIATVGYGHGQTSGRRVYDESYFTDLDAMRHTWAYCVGKTRAEQLAWDFARAHGMRLTTVHPGAIIGPALDRDASISLNLVIGLLNRETPAVPSNGFSLVDVRDVVAVHVAALERPEETAGERYIAASDYVPFPEVARILAEAYPDWGVTSRAVPDWIIRALAFFGGPSRQIINDIGNEKLFSGKKAEALLGRSLISGRDAILETARSAIDLGLARKQVSKAKSAPGR